MNDEPLELLDNPTDLRELQLEIGKWSRHNFGMQNSKVIPDSPPLNSMVPLLGMVEEYGELITAPTASDVEDAIGDIGVYLCDYCCREQIMLDTLTRRIFFDGQLDHHVGVISTIGLLCRITVKSHQGIRGYSDTSKYQDERDQSVVRLWGYLNLLSIDYEIGTIFDVVKNVYVESVLPRDWRNNPNTAAG